MWPEHGETEHGETEARRVMWTLLFPPSLQSAAVCVAIFCAAELIVWGGWIRWIQLWPLGRLYGALSVCKDKSEKRFHKASDII